MPLHSTISGTIRATQTNDLDLGRASVPIAAAFGIEFNSGVGDRQADLLFSDRRTLAASGTEDIDLAAVLANALGGTLTFAKIKAIYIKAADGNTNAVVVTRPASNGAPLFLAAGDGVSIPPGGILLRVAPLAAGLGTVTAGTGDLITITNSAAGTPVTYDIVIIGASA